MAPRRFFSKSAGAALEAPAIEPVATRSAKRAACPNGAERSINRTCRGMRLDSAAAALTARVLTPEPPLAEKKATIGADVREAAWASVAAAAATCCSQSLSSAMATLSTSWPMPASNPSLSRVSKIDLDRPRMLVTYRSPVRGAGRMSRSPGAGRRVRSSLPEASVIDCSAPPDARNMTTSPRVPPNRGVSPGASVTACIRRASARMAPSDSSAKTDDISRTRTRSCRTDGWSAPSSPLAATCGPSSPAPGPSRTSRAFKTPIMYQRPPRSTRASHTGLSNKPPPDLDSRRATRRSGPVRQQAPRTRLAAKIDRVLTTAINGDPRAVLDVKASDLLAEAGPVADVISAAIERAGMGLAAQLTVTQTFLRSGVEGELLDSLASPDHAVRIAGARLCGALRLPDAVPWLADMLDDPVPAVRAAAARALGRAGGRRVVDALMAPADRLPQYRVAKELSRAASDIDFESLLREGGAVGTTVTVLMACGLRGDALRTPLLVRMAQDRICDTQIRVAACRALAMIGDPAGADALRLLGTDPDAVVQKAAVRARMRISTAMRKRVS